MRNVVRVSIASLIILAIWANIARATECLTPRKWEPKLTSTPLDSNTNYIADSIDAMAPDNTISAIVSLNRCPDSTDLAFLATKGTVTYVGRYVSLVAITGTVANLKSLAAESNVAFVDEDHQNQLMLDVSNPSIRVRTSVTYSPNTIQDQYGLQGSGINIAIVDSGVDNGVHAGLPNTRFVGGYDAVADVVTDPDDQLGHGTHVAGIALGSGAPDGTYVGIAPQAGLVDIQVTYNGTFGDSTFIKALEKLLDNRVAWNVRVANLSLGDCTNSNGTDAKSAEVNRMVHEGIVAVVAAGNASNCGLGNFSQQTGSPGAADDGISVANNQDLGTVDRTDDIINPGSLQGPRPSDGDLDTDDELKPDLGAPGTSIISAQFNSANGYVSKTGTSMAAPHVAGCAALILQSQPAMTPLDVKELLIRTAEDRSPAGWDGAYGNGLVDCFAAVHQLIVNSKTDLLFTQNTNSPDPANWTSVDLYPTNSLVQEGTPNTVNARVTNNGPNSVSGFKVSVGVYNFSNSQQDYHICTANVSSVIPVGGSALVSCPWTPEVSGPPPGTVHACLKAEIVYPYDSNFANNRAQHNVDIEQTHSPATYRLSVVNPLNESLTVQLRGTFSQRTRGWSLTKSRDNFVMTGSDCPQLVTLTLTPLVGVTLPSSEAQADVQVVGIRQNLQEVSLGGVRIVALAPGANIPTMSQWGIVVSVLCLLGSGVVLLAQKRRRRVT
jgi:subtilisin family serine protease